MKKKFLLAITALVCVLCFAVGLFACNPTSSAKTNKFISVLDGVFASAGFTSAATSGSKAKAGAKSASENVAYAASASDESTIMTNIEGLYGLVKTNDNAGLLDDYNLKYLKGDALYQGANLAALFKSMAQVLGDSVFSTVYKVGEPNTVAKLEANDYYTLYGLERGQATVPSAIQIDFKEYDSGKFSFKLAQYSKMNDVSELRFTYYDSTRVALVVTLQGDIDEDFNNYDENYAAFSNAEYSIAIFGGEDYVRDSSDSAEIAEAVMKFAKNHLGFDNNTYKNLASIGNGKVIGAKESSQIDSKMSQNRYTNPYLGTNGNMNVKVANEYRIPDGVTEVATASIPATKKLIVPAHVEKILDAPFKYPQFVEEIVFEDPDNGSLVQIGNDDMVFYYPSGEFWYRMNTSRFFLLSFTKVKNFTLPKTVKKIEGPIYITTDMEVLDLSQYHPDYTLEEDELEDVKESDKQGYIVSLCTFLYNEGIAFYKELGSVKKLYVNGDYTLRYHGNLQMGGFEFVDFESIDINELLSIKLDINEYDAYNREEDKHYEYSPTADIYYSIFAMIASGEYDWQTLDYGEYRGYTKAGNLIDELIVTEVSDKLDLTSDLFKKVSFSADVNDFAKVYEILSKAETDKEISFTLTENGAPKTALNFFSSDGESGAIDERMYVKTPDGEKFISELEYKQAFYAPTLYDSVAGLYFVGWAFTPNASKADVYKGDKVVNYYQNMYAVYAPATDGIEYIDKDNGTVTAKIDGITADVIVVPDTYGGKRVEGISLINYDSKKIILPSSIGIANTAILRAIANGVVDGLNSITRFSDMDEGGIAWLYTGNNSSLIEKLKTCSSAVYDSNSGLYYLRNNASNYFMLIGADESASGQVFVSSQCYIIAGVEFGDSVTRVELGGYNDRLQYIGYMKFGSISGLSIPSSVKQIEYISGTVTGNFSFPSGDKCKINLRFEALADLHASGVFIEVSVLTEEALAELANNFSRDTKLYLSCAFGSEEMDLINRITDNMYFYSADKPDFSDEYIASFNYWYGYYQIWEK